MSEENRTVRTKPFVQSIVRGLKHLVLHNGWLKTIAIVISVLLWAGLISQDDTITRDKTFQNITVSVTGTESLRNSGYIVVSDLSEMLNDVSIVAAVPQKQYENAEASSFNVRLDLSRIKGTGEQEVRLLSTNSGTYGKVVSISPASISVQVEDYIVRQRIPASVYVNGEVPEGWYIAPPKADPTLIAVSGPRSLVEKVSKAKAFIDTDDIEWVEGELVQSVGVKLYDQPGEEISSPLISITTSSVTIDSIWATTTLMPKISFDTKEMLQVNGKVAKGYEIKEIRVSPETITVAALKQNLDEMTELLMDRTINVRNLSETTMFQLKVKKPSDEAVISNDTVTVTVVIEPVEQ